MSAPLPAGADSAPGVSNERVAAVFEEIADLLQLQGGNTFRIQAYRNAARLVGGLGRSLADMLQAGEDLDDLRGVGKDLAGKIAEVVAGGTCVQLEDLRRQTPAGMAELLQLPGLGPRRVQRLHRSLGIASLQALEDAAAQDRIRTVRGFGAVTQQRILEAVRARLRRDRRFALPEVAQSVSLLLAHLKSQPGVREAVAAGSVRRRRDTVGDVDLLVTGTRPGRTVEALTSYSGVTRVLAHGKTRAAVVLASGLQVDLRVVKAESFGAAWLYFTGSKAHNIALRRLAQDARLKLNEYGLYRGDRRIAGATEASLYEALGLRWIEPELREDRGEIEAARAGTLPALVDLLDLRGDLHAHGGSSLGRVGLLRLANAAIARGLRYLAICDPLLGAGQPGLDGAALDRQLRAIDAVNGALEGFRLLKGAEVAILEDGSPDLPAGADLGQLDLVVGAVRDGFDLAPARQTERLLRAMDQPRFSILAHPTNRLLLQRPPSAFDLERVLRHARERGCFVELNAQRNRLDLDERGCRMAAEAGVLVSISAEPRDEAGLADLLWGVGQARRGWLEARQVLNARPLAELLELLAPTMGRPRPVRAPSGKVAAT